MHLLLLAQAMHIFREWFGVANRWGLQGCVSFFLKYFTSPSMERALTQSHIKGQQHSSAVPHCQQEICAQRRGTHQPLKFEHRDRLTGHKTKQFASCGSSGVVKRNVFFHTFFPFLPSNFPLARQQKCSSSSECVGAELSLAALTTVFLRCAAWRGWGKAVFFWLWVVHAVSSDGHVSEAVFVPGCHMASKEKLSCRCCFRPRCWEPCEAVSSGQTVVSLLRKEIRC